MPLRQIGQVQRQELGLFGAGSLRVGPHRSGQPSSILRRNSPEGSGTSKCIILATHCYILAMNRELQGV
jgi:hypothetical protein